VICRVASSEVPPKQESVAKAIASAKVVAAVERLARSDPRFAATVDQWDAHAWLLNTPSGIVDLRTGKAGPHRPDAYMTKITAVAPGGDCPKWRQFLARITADDHTLAEFLQRMAGYTLTGSIREHALFFCFGTGSNGKSVFLNTLRAIFGDYAAVAPMETFIATRGERHPTDLAGLRGARLVAAQEIEKGRHWAEAKIKALTGGDPISARFMRQDFFTFIPEFKLVIAGNHKPSLRTVDEAIRRRMNLIPFTVTIPAAERDKDLYEKLKEEWPGILRWAIEGCLRSQKYGLAAPMAVTKATGEYLKAEDTFGLWLDECCGTGDPKRYKAANTALFASWKSWCERVGEQPGSQKAFSQALIREGFEQCSVGDGRGFAGLTMKEQSRW